MHILNQLRALYTRELNLVILDKATGLFINLSQTYIQTQADNCDRRVVGGRDQKLREYLIDLEDLTLLKAIQKAKQYVAHHSSVLQMRGHVSTSDSVVKLELAQLKTIP